MVFHKLRWIFASGNNKDGGFKKLQLGSFSSPNMLVESIYSCFDAKSSIFPLCYSCLEFLKDLYIKFYILEKSKGANLGKRK